MSGEHVRALRRNEGSESRGSDKKLGGWGRETKVKMGGSKRN